MLVMPVVAHEISHVVQKSGSSEQQSIPIGEAMNLTHAIEDLGSKSSDEVAVIRQIRSVSPTSCTQPARRRPRPGRPKREVFAR